jgi:hypothetical protein
MTYSDTNPFDFQVVLEHTLDLLNEEQKSDPVLREQIENHLYRRVVNIVAGLMRYEEVEPLMEVMERDPEMASEALNRFIAEHQEIQDQLGQEISHFDSLVSTDQKS